VVQGNPQRLARFADKRDRVLAWIELNVVVGGAIGIVLMLLLYKVYDLIDRRDFAQELAEGNTMLGMELEGLFILLSAVIVGAMNYTAG